MPSIFTHIAVPIAARIAGGKTSVPLSLLCTGLLLSILPDADVSLHRLGVPYESEFGHRGASHSVAFALVAATIGAFAYSRIVVGNLKWNSFFLFICAVSHPILDACTNAGHGSALFWPVSEERFFAPFRPIEASPLSPRRFFGEPGLQVLLSEFLWVWLPLLTFGLTCRAVIKMRGAAK